MTAWHSSTTLVTGETSICLSTLLVAGEGRHERGVLLHQTRELPAIATSLPQFDKQRLRTRICFGGVALLHGLIPGVIRVWHDRLHLPF